MWKIAHKFFNESFDICRQFPLFAEILIATFTPKLLRTMKRDTILIEQVCDRIVSSGNYAAFRFLHPDFLEAFLEKVSAIEPCEQIFGAMSSGDPPANRSQFELELNKLFCFVYEKQIQKSLVSKSLQSLGAQLSSIHEIPDRFRTLALDCALDISLPAFQAIVVAFLNIDPEIVNQLPERSGYSLGVFEAIQNKSREVVYKFLPYLEANLPPTDDPVLSAFLAQSATKPVSTELLRFCLRFSSFPQLHDKILYFWDLADDMEMKLEILLRISRSAFEISQAARKRWGFCIAEETIQQTFRFLVSSNAEPRIMDVVISQCGDCSRLQAFLLELSGSHKNFESLLQFLRFFSKLPGITPLVSLLEATHQLSHSPNVSNDEIYGIIRQMSVDDFLSSFFLILPNCSTLDTLGDLIGILLFYSNALIRDIFRKETSTLSLFDRLFKIVLDQQPDIFVPSVVSLFDFTQRLDLCWHMVALLIQVGIIALQLNDIRISVSFFQFLSRNKERIMEFPIVTDVVALALYSDAYFVFARDEILPGLQAEQKADLAGSDSFLLGLLGDDAASVDTVPDRVLERALVFGGNLLHTKLKLLIADKMLSDHSLNCIYQFALRSPELDPAVAVSFIELIQTRCPKLRNRRAILQVPRFIKTIDDLKVGAFIVKAMPPPDSPIIRAVAVGSS
jgi:hypothetical protein